MKSASPLRYPGGKWRVAPFFEQLIAVNYRKPPAYLEPYAGGGSLALSLLFRGFVSRVYLNDLDPAIHAFWTCVTSETSRFISRLQRTAVTPEEWHRQKAVYDSGSQAGTFALGFAAFFLNRTSHSGILNAGMIGGLSQKGAWKLDARFNRADLCNRIRRIAERRDSIQVSGQDALAFIRRHRNRGAGTLLYLDPPYYRPGRHLYLNGYGPDDHDHVRHAVRSLRIPWVVSYDDVPGIRSLYQGIRRRHVTLMHTAREARVGNELMFFSNSLRIPRSLCQGSRAMSAVVRRMAPARSQTWDDMPRRA